MSNTFLYYTFEHNATQTLVEDTKSERYIFRNNCAVTSSTHTERIKESAVAGATKILGSSL